MSHTPLQPVLISANQMHIQSLIARAKQEWECTADALPHIVCLVDEHRSVVRANRVVEAWGLGPVSNAIGRDVHSLLHPDGCGSFCELERKLADSWERVRFGGTDEFELIDNRLHRSVTISLRPIVGDSASRAPAGNAHAVLIVADVTDLHVARRALQTLNESLEVRVRARTNDLEDANRDLTNEIVRREAAEDALRKSRNELALLSQQLIKAQESERRRIAQELHDSIGQSLSAIKYSMERACELSRQERVVDTHVLLDRLVIRVQETIGEVRNIAMNLRPSILDDLGCASALAWFCREYAETYPRMRVLTDIAATDSEIPHRLATTIFRCTQELLNNVAKHAQATVVAVDVSRHASSMILAIRDDGVGINTSTSATGSYSISKQGHGIRNLRERAQMTGGRLTLSTAPGGGTLAHIEWNLTPDEIVEGQEGLER
jgi:signal transduction histidine kinase